MLRRPFGSSTRIAPAQIDFRRASVLHNWTSTSAPNGSSLGSVPHLSAVDSLSQGGTEGHELGGVACRRCEACLKNPESQIQVRPGQCGANDLVGRSPATKITGDHRLAVSNEPFFALDGPRLDEDAGTKAGAAEAGFREARVKAEVQISDVRQSSLTTCRSDDEAPGIQLLRFGVFTEVSMAFLRRPGGPARTAWGPPEPTFLQEKTLEAPILVEFRILWVPTGPNFKRPPFDR